MSLNKLIFFCTLFLLVKSDTTETHSKSCPNYRSNANLADAGLNAIKELENLARNGRLENIGKNVGQAVVKEIVASRCLENAGLNTGKNFGLRTITAVGGAITAGSGKALALGKAAGTAIVASSATPYILVGVGVAVVGFGVYKVYRYYNPTTGKIIEKNIEIARLDQSKTITLLRKAERKEAQAKLNRAKAELKKSELELHDAIAFKLATKTILEKTMANPIQA